MMFRDQTEDIASKGRIQNGIVKSRVIPSRRKMLGESPVLSSETIPIDPQLMAASLTTMDLCSSPEEQATFYFFRNYVLEDSTSGYFQYLLNIYENELVGPALTETITALGMVGLSNFYKTPSILMSAHQKYNSALRLVSSRLRNIEEAKADQTLVSVIMLGLYETNTCNSPQSMASWTKHISGAAALLHLRGKEALATRTGRQLFVHLRGQVVVNCLQRHAPVPKVVSEWSDIARQYQTGADLHAADLAEAVIRFCNLRASMDSFHDYSKAEHIVSSACEIDAELEAWAKNYPIECMYKTVMLKERSDEVFSDHYHIYENLLAATTWNHYRSVRILVNEVIITQLEGLKKERPYVFELSSSDSVFTDVRNKAANTTILQLSHDICASVPPLLGFKEGQEPSQHNTKAVSGNLLLWPLYSAACTPMVSDMMCRWVAGRLKMISEVIGIKQAGPLAHVLMKRQALLAWFSDKDDERKREVLLWKTEEMGPEPWTPEKLMELT